MQHLFTTLLALTLFGFTPGVSTRNATATGISAASINGTPVTNVFNMSGEAGYFTKLSLAFVVVWGTTAILNVYCEVSMDNSVWVRPSRCTDAVVHDCGPRIYQYVVADGTSHGLEVATNGYPYARCTFDDPGSGNGTITVQIILGR